MKNYFNKNSKISLSIFSPSGIFFSILFLMLTASCAFINKPPHSITFNGNSEIKAVPDVANFVITIREEQKEVFLAQQNTAEKTNKLLALLKENGVDAKDIKTQNYSISPKYDYQTKPINKPVFRGFEARQIILVKLRDLKKVGEILTNLAKLEIAEVEGPSFMVENIESLKQQAQAQAIEKTKNQAKITAQNLGISLKKIINFSEENNNPHFPMPLMARSFGSGADQSFIPNLETGEQKISSFVSITYEIE